jgi:hypothetical protein
LSYDAVGKIPAGYVHFWLAPRSHETDLAFTFNHTKL